MKTYKSVLINNKAYFVVHKLIYGGGKYWAVVKGRLCDDVIFRSNNRDEAVNYMMNIWQQSKAA